VGLNQKQLQQRKTHRVKAKKSPTKLLKIAVLLVPALIFIAICAIYGNHSQRQTAAQLSKTIKKHPGKSQASHSGSITKAVPAVDVAKVSQQERVTPDYSGQGGRRPCLRWGCCAQRRTAGNRGHSLGYHRASAGKCSMAGRLPKSR